MYIWISCFLFWSVFFGNYSIVFVVIYEVLLLSLMCQLGAKNKNYALEKHWL